MLLSILKFAGMRQKEFFEGIRPLTPPAFSCSLLSLLLQHFLSILIFPTAPFWISPHQIGPRPNPPFSLLLPFFFLPSSSPPSLAGSVQDAQETRREIKTNSTQHDTRKMALHTISRTTTTKYQQTHTTTTNPLPQQPNDHNNPMVKKDKRQEHKKSRRALFFCFFDWWQWWQYSGGSTTHIFQFHNLVWYSNFSKKLSFSEDGMRDWRCVCIWSYFGLCRKYLAACLVLLLVLLH